MSCSNCFNGCAEIVSDQCIKYTGKNIPELGIKNGDTLVSVQANLTTILVPMLTGNGIVPQVANDIVCNLVKKYLPSCATCKGFTLNEILIALIKSICDIQEQVTSLKVEVDKINSGFNIKCLENVTASSKIYDVVQSLIIKACATSDSLTSLILSLPSTYVSISNINNFIQSYLNNQIGSKDISNKMVPYVAVPFFDSNLTGKFDSTGAGIGIWNKIYLCNGQNGTPDLRGRTLVGATTMGGSSFNPAVDPGISGNPTYTMTTITGNNNVTLTTSQIPSHKHDHTLTLTDNKHRHNFSDDRNSPNDTIRSQNDIIPAADSRTGIISAAGDGRGRIYLTSAESSNISVSLNIANTGGGQSHSNIQPSRGCNYIIYIP